ncbi:MAG: dihydropteroate synthase [Rhodospirillales bacterium]|nr:dihydropteroate synthase [Alphaproteobacteria bacterium]MCB9976032.1 dihydropteroate synthase [Rhodospirillales bacterium]
MPRPAERLKKLLKDGPVLMGVLNVTPDSFSDGGKFSEPGRAYAHALNMVEQGASIIDIGGESTRPGADPVTTEEETARVIPVIRELKNKGPLISIDTRNAATMKAAMKAGAHILNDVTALSHDPQSLPLAASCDVTVCLMHMRGTPQTMQKAPQYEDVVEEVLRYLCDRAETCIRAGVKEDNIIIDPGIGFGKTPDHNLKLLKNIGRFVQTGFPVLLGASRKSFIAKVTGDNSAADQRVGGSLSSVLWGWSRGVRLFRVHDIKETSQALKIARAIENA